MLKALIEKRNALLTGMENVVNKAKEETRAFTVEELKLYEDSKKEVDALDKTIKAAEETRTAEEKEKVKGNKIDGEEEQRTLEEANALDEQNFLKFIKGEERALSVADNGGIIPTSIAQKIIEKVKEISPIYNLVEVYNVGGDLVFPVYDEGTSSISAAYVEDLTELTEGTGKFTTVKLQNFIVGCLAKVSKSLLNRTDFDLTNYVIGKVAQAIVEFLERELIKGTPSKMQGATSSTNVITSATINKVDTDDLIDLQMAVPEIYQANAVWIMSKATLKSFRKMKDLEGSYILQKDIVNGFGFTLLGRPVHITTSIDEIATGKNAVVYGDMTGLALKFAKGMQVQVLVEKYATQYAIGVVSHIEADSKVIDNQKIAVLKIK